MTWLEVVSEGCSTTFDYDLRVRQMRRHERFTWFYCVYSAVKNWRGLFYLRVDGESERTKISSEWKFETVLDAVLFFFGTKFDKLKIHRLLVSLLKEPLLLNLAINVCPKPPQTITSFWSKCKVMKTSLIYNETTAYDHNPPSTASSSTYPKQTSNRSSILFENLDITLLNSASSVHVHFLFLRGCYADEGLKGSFTKTQPIKNFNHSKLKIYM